MRFITIKTRVTIYFTLMMVLVVALVLIYAAISILGLLLGDILMAILDPRISFTKKEGSR